MKVKNTWTGIRTQDQLVKSQLLYQLSYPRIGMFASLSLSGRIIKPQPYLWQYFFNIFYIFLNHHHSLGLA